MSKPKRTWLLCLAGPALALGLSLPAAAQCPPKTVVSDTLLNADGTPAVGRVVVAWPTFQAGTCQVIAGQATVNVLSGSFSVELYANDAAVPAGTSYRVTYYLKSGRISTEYWVVPSSALPVTLAVVRSTSVPVPAMMVGQAQVTNLIPDLARKVELPSPCPAGKFLQANGATAPPQVSCVDGTGAPLASSAQSGTVKTDVTEADPQVYVKATTDTLLANKANAAHTHAAADTTSGVLDPARLPEPTASTLGGVKSAACSGADKVTGISTAGSITCGSDQTGGGSGSQHQVNGVNLSSNDPVNFQDSSTVALSNPSAGNISAEVKDSAVTAAKLSVSSPTAPQLSGVGDANLAAGALSPNRIAGTAEVLSNKGAANGYAALDSNSKVVQDPASAQTAPASNKIPAAGAGGTIDDGWLSANVTKLGSSIDLASEVAGTLPVGSGGTGATSASAARSNLGAAGTLSCTSQFVRATTNGGGTCATVGKPDAASTFVHTDQGNTWSAGEQDFTAVAGLRIKTGAGVPVSADCDAAGEVGRIYARSDANGTNATLYICSKTSATPTYAWELAQSAGGGGTVTNYSLWQPICQNGAASMPFDLATSATPQAACITGTNTLYGVADFDAAADEKVQGSFQLPPNWTGDIDLDIRWHAAATTGDVIWGLRTACSAAGESADPAWNTAQTVTDTAQGTANRLNDATLSAVTTAGCAAGEDFHFEFYRDADAAGDTMSGDARLVWIRFTIRRTQ